MDDGDLKSLVSKWATQKDLYECARGEIVCTLEEHTERFNAEFDMFGGAASRPLELSFDEWGLNDADWFLRVAVMAHSRQGALPYFKVGVELEFGQEEGLEYDVFEQAVLEGLPRNVVVRRRA
jgi:hypothetical protein